MSHYRKNKHDLVYTLSQPELRNLLTARIGTVTEEFVKYVYDGYTFAMGMKAIRKPKTRKHVQLAFHRSCESKEDAQLWVNKAVRYTKALN